MASPLTTGGPAAYGWPPAHPNQQPSGIPAASEADEMGIQVRPMALKVLYTFDKDSKVNCLARWPQTLHVQAIPIDERNWIGVVDLRLCVQAIAQGSPELASQAELDYAIYAVDYSEPDTPLVGQGMLSWVMDPAAAAAAQQFDEGPKMVTGRVAKNIMALFGNGVRETLEVRLKLSEVTRMARVDSAGSNRSNGIDSAQNQQARNAPTPTDTTEWNSFLQANPALGRSASISTMQSPSLAPARPDMSGYPPGLPVGMSGSSFDMGSRAMSQPASRPGSRPGSRQSSIPPSRLPTKSGPPLLAPRPPASAFASVSPPPLIRANDDPMSAPTPPPETGPTREVNPRPSRPSRPSSRSSRSRVPTGRPRGRPRKRQPTDGNTSAAEEVPTDADADDAHKKKRVKTTKADYPVKTSLDSAPDSLRVAASTSGALRTLRPIMLAAAAEGAAAPGSHLQEFPRAPTPVPQSSGPPSQHHARKMMAQKARRESLVNLDPSAFSDQAYARSVAAGSPTDSIAPSPENYTPEDSPADIGSSPPVPRTTSYVPQSSPIPSSPPLPPMRRPQPDSGFMSGGMDDLLFNEDDGLLHDKFLPPPTPQEAAAPTPNMEFLQPLPPLPDVPATTDQSAPATARPSKLANQPSNRKNNGRTTEQFSFLTMNPGPPELLPTTVLYNPPPQPKPRTGKNQRANSTVTKPPPATLERSHSEPANLAQPEQHQPKPHLGQRQQSQLQQQSFPLPSDLDGELDAQMAIYSDMQPPQVESYRTTASPFSLIDVPDDMKELAKLLAASADNGRDTASQANATASLAASAAALGNLESAKSPQTQPSLPQQPSAEVARVTKAPSVPLFPARATAVPASDPPALPPLTLPALPPPPTAFSEAPCPPSDVDVPNGRSSKNLVRKAAIRERLKQAIQSGETPPYCQNCGAIETPTWRKMWTQDHDGEPGFYDFTDKSNPITFIEILERDADGKSTRYRLVRKALSNTENGKLWTQMLLCNPCGIWLGKFKSHRPQDRWDKDFSRLSQTRGSKSDSRSRKSRAKSDPQVQPTSEAYFTTDPAGPAESEDNAAPGAPVSPIVLHDTPPAASQHASSVGFALPLPAATAAKAAFLPPPPPPPPATTIPEPATTAESKETDDSNGLVHQLGFKAGSNQGPASSGGSANRRGPGSTHSRGSGTANSPIAVDDQFGATRRLLFPSPRKDGVLKVLGELAVNVIGTVLGSPKPKNNPPKFEAIERPDAKQNKHAEAGFDQDDMADLFGTPPPTTRPSTPPPKPGSENSPAFASGPFKTPTRPTPNHRPITRSVSKSIVRSAIPYPTSPAMDGLMLLQRTPSKTPRAMPCSANKQRRLASATPGRQQTLHVPLQLDDMPFDTPLTSTLNQLLSEANDFTTGSPSHGLTDLDLASFANLDSDDLAAGFGSSTADLDFGSYLDTDLVMPSSSPLLGRKNASKHQHVSFGGALSFEASESMWSDFNDAEMDGEKLGQTA